MPRVVKREGRFEVAPFYCLDGYLPDLVICARASDLSYCIFYDLWCLGASNNGHGFPIWLKWDYYVSSISWIPESRHLYPFYHRGARGWISSRIPHNRQSVFLAIIHKHKKKTIQKDKAPSLPHSPSPPSSHAPNSSNRFPSSSSSPFPSPSFSLPPPFPSLFRNFSPP